MKTYYVVSFAAVLSTFACGPKSGPPTEVDVAKARAAFTAKELSQVVDVSEVAIAPDGSEVAFGGDGEASLDDVDAQVGELACHAEFFGDVHGEAGRLFAVTQCGVEEADEVHAAHPPRVWGQ